MKTVILILVMILPGFFATGQDSGKNKSREKIQDLPEKFQQESDEFKQMPSSKFNYRDLLDEFNRQFNKDSSLTDQFPGADRYYAKRPVLAPYGGFIAEPDTSVKLYLIIVDPLRNTIRK